jgi:hypothetical protein
MKHFLRILTFVFAVLYNCTSQKKAEYDFPPQMLPHVQKAFKAQCDKGQTLYNLNCAKCHNYKVKGRTTIPDFRIEKLVGYTLRITNAKHKSELRDSSITTEELGLIMTFLTYKKKNPPKKN